MWKLSSTFRTAFLQCYRTILKIIELIQQYDSLLDRDIRSSCKYHGGHSHLCLHILPEDRCFMTPVLRLKAVISKPLPQFSCKIPQHLLHFQHCLVREVSVLVLQHYGTPAGLINPSLELFQVDVGVHLLLLRLCVGVEHLLEFGPHLQLFPDGSHVVLLVPHQRFDLKLEEVHVEFRMLFDFFVHLANEAQSGL